MRISDWSSDVCSSDLQLNLLTVENSAEKNKEWQKEMPFFYHDFMNYMLEAGDPKDTIETVRNLKEIVQNKDFLALKESVKTTFPSFREQEAGLTDAFKRIKYYFPRDRNSVV